MKISISSALLITLALSLAACGERATLQVEDGSGEKPALPEPVKTLLPTVHIARAIGWPEGTQPIAAKGFTVSAFATGLDHPRWLYVLPNGDVLVAESQAPKKGIKPTIKDRVADAVMKRAGAAGVSADRITLLRDADGDGVAETQTRFLQNLHSPFGMALVGTSLYVANADAVMRYTYEPGTTEIKGAGTKLADLPGGPINHHWTKNIIASTDGKFLYATVGSNSNVGENGLDNEVNRAAILEIALDSGRVTPYATGLRNPNGLAWNPQSGQLWTTVNERDELGSDLVPDYMTSVQRGGFYGWPYSYYGAHVDERVQPQRPDLVARALVPDYALGPHTASLGLAFYSGSTWPASYHNGAIVGQHGSWNRKPRSGYKVIFVPFAEGKPAGVAQTLLDGFVNEKGDAMGRPVGVVFDTRDALLVADDVGNVIWRVRPAP